MIDCAAYYELLNKCGFSFFAGVPDSLLKDICAYISDHTDPSSHIIAANEGAAVALAAGHYMATKQVGLVYLQNSGLGNTINPLTSLVDAKVYSIPVLLFIGWRGEPGVKDEPQHVKQGEITLNMLETLGIPYQIQPDTMEAAEACLETAVRHFQEKSSPFALVVRKETFAPYKLKNTQPNQYELTREQAIVSILEELSPDEIVVSTTGMTSREVYEYRTRSGARPGRDFLTVGCMGHSSQIALAIAQAKPHRQVYTLDGDGAAIMHMGSLAITGNQKLKNFKHVILNNGAHDSVGGQPTVGLSIDIPKIALACGYTEASSARTSGELKAAIAKLRACAGPALLEVFVNKGARSNLGRPTSTPIENKQAFMAMLDQQFH